jgi:hypothetical protein
MWVPHAGSYIIATQPTLNVQKLAIWYPVTDCPWRQRWRMRESGLGENTCLCRDARVWWNEIWWQWCWGQCLTCLDLSGLDPSISSLCGSTLVQYAGSLVGRDFRASCYICSYDLLDPAIIETWSALAMLLLLVWQPQIHNMDVYLVSRRQDPTWTIIIRGIIPDEAQVLVFNTGYRRVNLPDPYPYPPVTRTRKRGYG